MTILSGKDRTERQEELRREAFTEQLKYYKNANKDRDRGRVGRALVLICIAIIIAGFLQLNWASIVLMSSYGVVINGISLSPLAGIPILAIGLGALALLCLVAGIILLFDLE